MAESSRLAARLLRWFDKHGRHDLPWQRPRSAYRVWVAEIMLQQTRVATVIPYFRQFLKRFGSLRALANADIDDVLAAWAGLGYYSRARNLHRAAQLCLEHHGGRLPRDFDKLQALPGIGRSTAGAILAQAHELPFPILDGNVKRVLIRCHGLFGDPDSAALQQQLWQLAADHLPKRRIADYTQAIMDLGATVCTRNQPACRSCPLRKDCLACRDGLTDALPQRKATRSLPTRQTIMLILRDRDGRILLQRRPPNGVWAQMWSLPEVIDETRAMEQVALSCGTASKRIGFRRLPAFRHTFSHFHLQVTPLQMDIQPKSQINDDPDRRWLHPHQTDTIGIPTPVRKLILSIAE